MSNRTKNILGGCVMAALVLVSVVPLFSIADPGVIEFAPTLKTGSIFEFVELIINEIVLPIGAVVAVLMVMYAGFKYVTAQGNPGQIKEATKALQYALIGSAILLGAWVITNAIKATIGQLKV